MKITPVIIGSGNSGQALAQAMSVLALTSPELQIAPTEFIPRDAAHKSIREKFETPLLFIANPHGLHAKTILEANAAGFSAIICEKPSCVSEQELNSLREIKNEIAILHVYRQMWGPQTLKSMITSGELGEIISIEGRYWQSSTAARTLAPISVTAVKGWKNDQALSGPSDAFLDIGVHWVDVACFLHGQIPIAISGWRSYINAESSHRDSHVQLALSFSQGGRSLASLSKTVHGATNHFEVNVLGSRKSAAWHFMNPDEILIGEGKDRRVVTRKTSDLGSRLPPHHSLGWLEGHVEICRQYIKTVFFNEPGNYPNLQENLKMMEALFKTQWQK